LDLTLIKLSADQLDSTLTVFWEPVSSHPLFLSYSLLQGSLEEESNREEGTDSHRESDRNQALSSETPLYLHPTSQPSTQPSQNPTQPRETEDRRTPQLTDREIQRVFDFAEHDPVLGGKLTKTIRIIEDSLRLWGEGRVGVSFNGGKDCTVLLHIYYAVVCREHQRYRNGSAKFPKVKGLYVKPPQGLSFPEVEEFVRSSVDRYHLDLEELSGPMKPALQKFHSLHPNIFGIFIGIRKGDPHSENLESFTPCDKDWPPFMRINAILDWTYSDIWHFLRELNIPYCSLYDRGYTSIGHTKNTLPNSALVDPADPSRHLPAYLLTDPDRERQGRVSK